MWRKTILATAIVGAGLTSTAGAAFAGESPANDVDASNSHDHGGHEGHGKDHDGHGHGKGHHRGQKQGNGCENDVAAQNGDGHTEQSGVFNVDDVQTIVPTNVCGNDVPVNVLGLQIPVQHLTGNVPILSGADHGSSNSAES